MFCFKIRNKKMVVEMESVLFQIYHPHEHERSDKIIKSKIKSVRSGVRFFLKMPQSVRFLSGFSDTFRDTERLLYPKRYGVVVLEVNEFKEDRGVKKTTPDRIRTCGTRFRKPVLYPPELRGQRIIRG
jgi:hypothetical protein